VRRILLLVVCGGIAFIGWVALPVPRRMLSAPTTPSVTLRDRHGVVLRTTRAADGTRQRWVAFADMDPQVVQAFVAVEDRRFFDHHGVDPRAMARAFLSDVRSGRVVSGASTITMQLARELTGAGRSWPGKLAQIAWALRLDAHLTKQEILEQYLNRVDLGQGVVGVPAAAALYFASSANTIGLARAAMLAGLAHAPSRDNPFTAPSRARARRAYALKRMSALGLALQADVARANREPLTSPDRATAFFAPHFTAHVLSTWRPHPGDADVMTSLDLGLQQEIEAEVRSTVDALHDRGVRQAAVVVLSNRTGEILAWVGSPDFWADSNGQTDMVISPRQPGSALKPFLYGLAFDVGYTPATLLSDVPRTYQTAIGPYHPRNYDRRYHGLVRAREALASSYNVPAVALADTLGVDRFLRTLHVAGFASLDRSSEFYGLALALGDGDVTLLELANAYRSLANRGVWRPAHWDMGNAHADDRRVVSAQSAALVLDILTDPDARTPAFGSVTPFDFPFPVAVKTGTSRHFTDNWAVGATGEFTVAVWAGNFTGQPMAGVSGVTGAGPLLHRAVMLTARRYQPGVIVTPASVGAEPVRICRQSGARAEPGCPYVTEWFAPGTTPSETPPPPARVALHLVSPHDGDAYAIPPGVDSHYATLALRAEGASPMSWSVDGRPVSTNRWTLVPGVHTVSVTSSTGEIVTAHIEVQ